MTTTKRRRGAAGRRSTWESLIDDWLTWLIGVGRSPRTVQLRGEQLRQAARELGGHPNVITESDLVSWMARHEWKPETRRSYRAALRGFFEWTAASQLTMHNPAAKLPAVKAHAGPPRPVDDTAWRDALAKADRRVTLMLRLAGEAGLRRGEVARVHTGDVIEGMAGPQLVVHGKGNKVRVVPISDGLAALVRLGAAGHTEGAPGTGWLFPYLDSSDHLSEPWVGALISRVLPEGVTPHGLRHRYATRAYRGSKNLRAVQHLLGHTSVATTQRYTAVDDDEIRAAAMAAALSPGI